MEEYLALSRYTGEGLGHASSDETDFDDSPWEALSSLRNGCGGRGRRWSESEERRERELGLVCKIKKII